MYWSGVVAAEGQSEVPSPSRTQFMGLCFQVTLKINEIGRIALRDFKGLENCDANTRRMVLDFSLNVAQRNMDQAFR